MFDKLINVFITVILVSVLQARKSPDSHHIKIFSHDASGIFYMLCLISLHDYPILKLKLPPFFINIKNNGFHPEIAGCNLCTEPGSHTRIKKQHSQGFMPAQG